MILSALDLPFPHGFVFGNSRVTSEWVTYPGSAMAYFSLNFGVPTKPEASELPKSLVLDRDGNIHLRITPPDDVECYNPPPRLALIPFLSHLGLGPPHPRTVPPPVLVTSRPGSTTSRARSTSVARYCLLWAYHSLTVLFLGTHEQLPNGSPILGVLWPPSRLTSEFLRNSKPVSFQKTSITPLGDVGCYIYPFTTEKKKGKGMQKLSFIGKMAQIEFHKILKLSFKVKPKRS
ncbi:hypothetical protein DVH24_033984 [Malus domestica]|uniref:Uncharacterized protein n=1 Tax=Malus domestica TaxID=3750 RepID=A0A498KP52_MALDO|nr:hypothetical protein DVH24_033984 [Malus domestica]